MSEQAEDLPFHVHNRTWWETKYPPDIPGNLSPGKYLELSDRPEDPQLRLFPTPRSERAADSALVLRSYFDMILGIEGKMDKLKEGRAAAFTSLEGLGYSKEALRALKHMIKAKRAPILTMSRTVALEQDNAARLAHLVQLLGVEDDPEECEDEEDEDDRDFYEDSEQDFDQPDLDGLSGEEEEPAEEASSSSAEPPTPLDERREKSLQTTRQMLLDHVRTGNKKQDILAAVAGIRGKAKATIEQIWEELVAEGQILKQGRMYLVAGSTPSQDNQRQTEWGDWTPEKVGELLDQAVREGRGRMESIEQVELATGRHQFLIRPIWDRSEQSGRYVAHGRAWRIVESEAVASGQ